MARATSSCNAFAIATFVVLTGDRPVAGGYFGVRTAAAVAVVVAQQLRRHPWLAAVDSWCRHRQSSWQSVGFATSQRTVALLVRFVEAYKKAENLMSSLEFYL